MVNAMSDVLSTTTYSPYGVPDSPISGFAFTGEQRDTNGLQYHHARYYNAGLGTWASLEGIHERPMSLNGYAWVEGNTINETDSSGLCMDRNTADAILSNQNNYAQIEIDPCNLGSMGDVVSTTSGVFGLTTSSIVRLNSRLITVGTSRISLAFNMLSAACALQNHDNARALFSVSLAITDLVGLALSLYPPTAGVGLIVGLAGFLVGTADTLIRTYNLQSIGQIISQIIEDSRYIPPIPNSSGMCPYGSQQPWYEEEGFSRVYEIDCRNGAGQSLCIPRSVETIRAGLRIAEHDIAIAIGASYTTSVIDTQRLQENFLRNLSQETIGTISGRIESEVPSIANLNNPWDTYSLLTFLVLTGIRENGINISNNDTVYQVFRSRIARDEWYHGFDSMYNSIASGSWKNVQCN
jgi:RHS repeat-associated protein